MDKRLPKRGSLRLVALFRSSRRGKLGHTVPRHRGWAVVVCILLSVLLWFFFSMRRSTFIDITLPTRVVNLPPGESLSTAPPSSITYRIRGDGLSLLPVYYNRPVVEIDASQAEIDFGLNASEFAGEARIESASPPTYYPQLEPSLEVLVPIRLVADISVASSHEFVDSPRLAPDSVVVSGARSIVTGIESWPTVSYEMSNFRDSLQATLQLADSLGGLVKLGLTQTQLTAVADAFTQGSRKIGIRITGAPNDRTLAILDPEIVTVTYRVRVSDYSRALTSSEFYATVLFSEIRGDTTGSVVPMINTPRGLLIRDVEMTPSSLNYFNFIE